MADEISTNTTHVSSISPFNNNRRPNAFLKAMARYPHLFCVFLTIISTFIFDYAYSTSKGKPVILSPSPPKFMFPPPSPVHDAPLGSLGPLIQMLHKEDIVFVLYYAPWCTKSRASQAEYIKAANYLKGQVQFAAVNCWWPEGECKKRYKFLMFPVLMAYHTKLDGYRFHGPFRAEHIIKFAEKLMHPLTLVHSVDEAVHLVALHDTVIFGHFNLSASDQIGSYRQFYFASMRIIERDPLQPVRLATVTQASVAKQLGMADYEEIVMHRVANSSQVYPYGKNITSSLLVRWSLETKSQEMVRRLAPEGVKSRALATEIDKGPAFILFHVDDPLFNTDLKHKMVKDLAILYNNCKIQPLFKDARQTFHKLSQEMLVDYQEVVRSCSKLKQQETTQEQEKKQQPSTALCCVSAVVHKGNVNDSICSMCCPPNTHSHVRCQPINHILKVPTRWANSGRGNTTSNHTNNNASHLHHQRKNNLPFDCRNMQLNYSKAGRVSICCKQGSSTYAQENSLGKTDQESDWLIDDDKNISVDDQHHWSLWDAFDSDFLSEKGSRRLTDRYVRDHLENIPRRMCDRLSLQHQQRISPMGPISSLRLDPGIGISTVELESRWDGRFSNFACRDESANKSLNFYTVDQQNHWMFADVLGLKNLERNGSMYPAALIVDKENDQHFVMKENLTYLNTLSFITNFELGRLRRHQDVHSFPQPDDCSEGESVCVRELDTNTFNNVIMNESVDVVLLIYAHWCGFCHTFSHTFLAVAQYFSPSNITFARINGASNDLPWQYTFTSYPAVVFFPAKRKSDSVVYSPLHHRSLSDLVRFVLQHSQSSLRLLHASHFCSRDCMLRNTQHSLRVLRRLTGRTKRLQAKLWEISSIESLSSNINNKLISPDAEDSDKDDLILSHIDKQNIASNKGTSSVQQGDDNKDIDDLSIADHGAEQLNEKLAVIKGTSFYSSLSIDYLKNRLVETRRKIDVVKRVLNLLQDGQGGSISKQELLNVMQFKDKSLRG